MRGLLVALGLLAALAVQYAPHLARAGFVYEDAQVASGAAPAVTWQGRSLTAASWGWVNTPRGAHLLNLCLHLLVVLLTWAVMRRIALGWWAAGIAGVMALHPLTVETVAYAASRTELIAAVGVLLALLCVTARSAWTWLLVPPCLVLAYLGKETGVVALGLIPLVLWRRGDHLLAECVIWVAVAAAILTLTVEPAWISVGETPNVQIAAWQWAVIQIIAVWRLLVLSVAPLWLSVSPAIPGAPIVAAAALALMAGLCEIAWRSRTERPWRTFGLVWIALVAAPRFIVQTPLGPFNEHQWYLAMVGVACVVMDAIDHAGFQVFSCLGLGCRRGSEAILPQVGPSSRLLDGVACTATSPAAAYCSRRGASRPSGRRRPRTASAPATRAAGTRSRNCDSSPVAAALSACRAASDASSACAGRDRSGSSFAPARVAVEPRTANTIEFPREQHITTKFTRATWNIMVSRQACAFPSSHLSILAGVA